MAEPNVKIEYIETLCLQLTEVDMLTSMYPNEDEFVVNDPSILADIKAFVNEETECLPPRLDFTLNIRVLGKPSGTVEMRCNLPQSYPKVIPEIFARSENFKRIEQHEFNKELQGYINSLDEGVLCIGLLIQWIQDNASLYFTLRDTHKNKTNEKRRDLFFNRLWIYSHHIYSKEKRKTILNLAHDYRINGFCLPGKPGIICLEGPESSVNEVWLNIKLLNWKKIELCHKENQEIGNKDLGSFYKFKDFKELELDCRKGAGKEYHMDFGQFFEFLDKLGCSFIFKILFGMEGKSVANS